MAKHQRICSISDCGKAWRSRGLCGRHYQRLLAYGDPLAGGTFRGDPLKWIETHAFHTSGECLTWPFARTGKGVANIQYGDQQMPAARLMCIMAHGGPPEIDLQTAHSCGNGHLGCVNPVHLRWATQIENSSDMIAHGTSTAGERHPMVKLSEKDVIAIRSMKGRYSLSQLSQMFGVGRANLSLIIRGKTWRHLLD